MARALWEDWGSQGLCGCGLSRLIAGHRGPNASQQRHHLAERGGGVKLVMVLVLVLAHRTTTKESTCIIQGQLTTKVRTLPTCSLQNGRCRFGRTCASQLANPQQVVEYLCMAVRLPD